DQALGEGQQLVGVAAVVSQDERLGHGGVDLPEHPEIGGDEEDGRGQDGHAQQPEARTQRLPPPYLSCHVVFSFNHCGAGVTSAPASMVNRGSLRSASPERTTRPSGPTPPRYAPDRYRISLAASARRPNSRRCSPSTTMRPRSVTPSVTMPRRWRRSKRARISPRRLVTPRTKSGVPGTGVKRVRRATSRTKRLSMA